jgi:hypothetical protein
MRAAFGISVLALSLSAGSVALAQDGSSEPTPAQVRVAAEAFDKGREAYKAEEYVEAAEQFEKADNNAPSPAAIELAIRSRDKAGELDRAATLASLALKRHPEDQNLLRLAGDLAKRARPTLFELTATCDEPCDLTVNGKLVHGAPDTQRLLYVAPGALTVRAGWSDNRSDSKQVQAQAGGQAEVVFTAPPVPAVQSTSKEPEPAAPPPIAANPQKDEGAPKSSGWSPTVFYVGAGLTAVLGGITVWSGIDTVNNPGADRVKKECGELMQGEDCELYKQGLSKQRRTNVLIGVTAGVGVGTALIGLLATDWSGGKASSENKAAQRMRPRVNVTPYAALDGGGLQAVGRF